MSDRFAWSLAAVLALVAGVQAAALAKPESGFATLPIFVPVTLGVEQQMRAQRNQPAGRGGEEAMELAQRLLDAPPSTADRAKVEALRDTRAKLLDARGRRHGLNIRLMDVGVAVAAELTPDQWDRIHMKRDALRAKVDAEVFDRVLEKMR